MVDNFLVPHKDFCMFFSAHVSPHKHLLLNITAVFTLGKLMNVKEDYGELSSIARSVHVIDKSILFLFLRYCKDCTQFANLCANNS
jgi:hypothetical protein